MPKKDGDRCWTSQLSGLTELRQAQSHLHATSLTKLRQVSLL